MKRLWQVFALGLIICAAAAYAVDYCGVQMFVSQFLPHAGLLLAMPAVVAPFPVDPELTSIAVAYKNTSLIADSVFPRVPVGLQNFKYRKYALADGFTIPKTQVGRTSAPSRVEFGFTEEDSSTNDNALDEMVPLVDIENAPAGYNPKARAAMSVIDLVLLAREKRAADLCFGAANYAASNKVTLAGNDQWSDYVNSNPVDAILAKMDACIMRPNKIVFGQAVWTKVRQHPKVVKAVLGNSGDSGAVNRQQVAELLEVEEILVGSGWYNTANKGQAATMSRLWGKFCAMIYQDSMADTRGRITWGLTAQFNNRFAGEIPDPDCGYRGGIKVRAGESVRELITANDLGYLFSDAVA